LRASGGITRNWGVATEAEKKFAGDPSVAIWMWPSPGERGCLETLLWKVIEKRHPIEAACVEAACACSGANQWSISKYHKARVRCFLSLKHRSNPAISLSILWRDIPGLVPVTDTVFTPYSDFLRMVSA
jgi:hypothetical protein